MTTEPKQHPKPWQNEERAFRSVLAHLGRPQVIAPSDLTEKQERKRAENRARGERRLARLEAARARLALDIPPSPPHP